MIPSPSPIPTRRRHAIDIESAPLYPVPPGRSAPPMDRPGTLLLVALWYCAGVLSIATTKVLLSPPYGLSPLLLSFLQFAISSLLLSVVYPAADSAAGPGLTGVSLSYGAGFVLTNISFGLGSPPFVETIKSSEPLTSAGVAFTSGLDAVSYGEVGGLIIIAAGAVLAASSSSPPSSNSDSFNYNVHIHGRERHTTYPLPADNPAASVGLWYVAGVVMISNLCFSLRGLYQKRLGKIKRRTADESNRKNKDKKSTIENAALQLWMNRISACATLPVLLLHRLLSSSGRPLLATSPFHHLSLIPLLLLNSILFCTYNLASTMVLGRISMLHHAAVNAMRRVFAVVVTSVFFRIVPSARATVGLAACIGGFGIFTYQKAQKGKGLRSMNRRTSLLPTGPPMV